MDEYIYIWRSRSMSFNVEILNVEKISLLQVLEHYLDGQMKESKKKASICIKNNTSSNEWKYSNVKVNVKVIKYSTSELQFWNIRFSHVLEQY